MIKEIRIEDIRILQSLTETGEVRYKDFRRDYNPWFSNDYFDRKIKELYNKGFVNYHQGRCICITDKGNEILENVALIW